MQFESTYVPSATRDSKPYHNIIFFKGNGLKYFTPFQSCYFLRKMPNVWCISPMNEQNVSRVNKCVPSATHLWRWLFLRSVSSGKNTSGKQERPVVVHICTSCYPFYPFYVVLLFPYMQCPLRNKIVPSATDSI